ncbi:MAG: VWA domain-containing protein [Acidobacteria bacterium]|nr:VWA domain-containing protein [Acidobacteriota bacterium]MBI3423730.1 VWA domain-containing protein [Acidobacteriota bacterium]
MNQPRNRFSGKSAAVGLCLLLLPAGFTAPAALAQALPAALATPQGAAEAVRIKTEMVSLTVSVIDEEGRHFTGLDSKAFTVFENGVAQEVSFFSLADGPASVGIVFDFSNSMTGTRLAHARTALARFVQTSHPDDEYCLIGFNNRAQLLLERTRDAEALLRRADGLTPRGHTALYDAIALGLAQARQGRHAKRALVIISDGEDNHSRLGFNALRRLALEADARIYAIVISDFFSLRKPGERLSELATATGGSVHYPANAERMNEAFEQIALQLRQHYSLGYLPMNFSADGKWRKLKVKVAPPPDTPKLVVRSRAGYYANADRAARERGMAALDND